MSTIQKSYLDLFLDNSIEKKRGIYFSNEHEDAIIKFNNLETSNREKLKLFNEFIEPAFRRVVGGVLEMPMFHYLGKINRDELIDAAFFRMVEKLHKFQPDMIGKNGMPVKAYSYFSTIAKNFILEYKVRFEKIQKHKADVESSIDLSILSEDTLDKLSYSDKESITFDTAESIFNETRDKVLKIIEGILQEEELKDEKKDIDLLKIGYTLKYLIVKWDKIEFMKKNEFMRILALYTGLKQQKVSFLFKKFKLSILEILNPYYIKTSKTVEIEVEEEEEIDIDIESDEEIDIEALLIAEKEEEDEPRFYSTEEYEIYLEQENNKKVKECLKSKQVIPSKLMNNS